MNRKWKLIFGTVTVFYTANVVVAALEVLKLEKKVKFLTFERDLARAIAHDLAPHVDPEIRQKIQTEVDFAEIIMHNK